MKDSDKARFIGKCKALWQNLRIELSKNVAILSSLLRNNTPNINRHFNIYLLPVGSDMK